MNQERMTRIALPGRRRSMVETIELNGLAYEVCFGWVKEKDCIRILEVFVTTDSKQGSAAHVACCDAAVLVSLLLQYGVTADEIGHSMLRTGGGPTEAAHEPASIIGRVIDRISEIEKAWKLRHSGISKLVVDDREAPGS